jgi:hypothetical protein
MNGQSKDERFEQLFPMPENRPRPALRVGSMPPAKSLPSASLQHSDSAPRPPFQIVWEDASIGLRLKVREQPDGQVIATVEADTQEHLGEIVSLALVGAEPEHLVRQKITLVAGDQGGCRGEAEFGTIDELRSTLGAVIQPTHFLISKADNA